MKKLQLHWQILIALILAIIYGIVFPTQHGIHEKSYKVLKRGGVEKSVTDQLRTIEGKVYDRQDRFEKEIEQLIGSDAYKKNNQVILKAAYLNKAVNWVS